MNQPAKRPIWVDMAFSIIQKRKHALWLISVNIVFALYCVPWARFLETPEWFQTLFIIDDWSWLLMMMAILVWYSICLRWMDNNSAWEG